MDKSPPGVGRVFNAEAIREAGLLGYQAPDTPKASCSEPVEQVALWSQLADGNRCAEKFHPGDRCPGHDEV